MDTLKAQARSLRKTQEREARNTARSERSRRRRCFWTWPLGHEYVNLGTDAEPDLVCVSCDQPAVTTQPLLADVRH